MQALGVLPSVRVQGLGSSYYCSRMLKGEWGRGSEPPPQDLESALPMVMILVTFGPSPSRFAGFGGFASRMLSTRRILRKPGGLTT